MKCKSLNHQWWGGHSSGLIEAYWNVNADYSCREACDYDGLIEAYWNVNGEYFDYHDDTCIAV